MRRLTFVLFALLTLSCSRYETKTADGMTLRIDKASGKTEIMVRGPNGPQWKPVQEASTCAPAESWSKMSQADRDFWTRGGVNPCAAHN